MPRVSMGGDGGPVSDGPEADHDTDVPAKFAVPAAGIAYA